MDSSGRIYGHVGACEEMIIPAVRAFRPIAFINMSFVTQPSSCQGLNILVNAAIEFWLYILKLEMSEISASITIYTELTIASYSNRMTSPRMRKVVL